MPALVIIGIIAVGGFVGVVIRLLARGWKDGAGDWSSSGYAERNTAGQPRKETVACSGGTGAPVAPGAPKSIREAV